MESHASLGDNSISLNLGTGRVVKRPRIELHTTKLVEQESATADIFGSHGIENIDPIEVKRQKARERYASMTEEQKANKNAKRRENYHHKKGESQAANVAPETSSSYPIQLATNMATETPGFKGIGNIDPTELKRQKARERYSSMTEEQKAHSNARRRENYHRKKAESLASNMVPETFSSYPLQLETNMSTETPGFHPLGEGVAVQDLQLQKKYTNTSLHDFIFVEPTIEKQALAGTDFVDLSPEELKRERERNRYSDMSKVAIHEKVLKIQNIRRNNKVTTQASNPINRGEQDYFSEAATFGTSPTVTTEVLTRSKTRGAINGMNIDSGPILNQLESGIWEPDDPNVTFEEEDLECLDPKEGEPDIYEDDESRVFHDRDFCYETSLDPDVAVQEHDTFDSIYQNLPRSHHILRNVPNCEYCGAIKFPGEGEAFCCRKGKVNIYIPNVPDELRRLFTSQKDKDALYFRNNIRYFNSHFSFTSFGATIDRRLATPAGTGVYTFKVHGQIYHKIDQLKPGSKGPRHMQLYFYDTDESMPHRAKRSPHLNENVIRTILETFEDNPYVHTFRSMGQVDNLDQYRIELNTSISVDQRRFNAPAMDQVAAIWQEGSDAQRRFSRSIMVYPNSGHAYFIRAYHGCYDPLAYPLFYPRGETGWEDKKILLEETPIIRFPRKKKKYNKREKPGTETHIVVECNVIDGRPSKRKKAVMDPEVHQDIETYNVAGDGSDDEGDDGDGGNSRSRVHVSAREYYCYIMQIRDGAFNIFFHGGRLFQQWIVDVYIKIESMRLDWYSKPENQKIIRADLYQGILDTLASGEIAGLRAGKRVILSKDFPGSDRDVHCRFMDAMALVERYGRPDYFLTMTCNPYWPEIMEQLLPGQTPQDRPDVVARVYHAKLLDLHDFLINKGHFGKVAAWAHVTEFQKRGLPHEHFLLIMDKSAKLNGPDDFDKHISAELPDPKKYPVLHQLVCKHMMHGPCGTLNRQCACMVDGKCRFDYPRQFCDATQQGKDAYPIYRRREDGQKVYIRKTWLDNRWVVPYNPTLLMRYNCHINVEVCCSIKSVKYIYKYIYKGHDCASFAVQDCNENGPVEIDEIKQYRQARCITAIEAIYRLYGFSMFSMSPPVLQMQVHLPGLHMVAFKDTDNLEDVAERTQSQKSMLTEYFRMNREDPNAHKYLYREFPEHYTWNKSKKIWKPRKQRFQIGRLVYANPGDDRYYLRVLLNHVRGATSFDALRTVRDVVYPSFRAACQELGLVSSDSSLDDALTEATSFKMPCALRRMFAFIIIFCECTNIRGLWDKHFESMAEDYRRTHGTSASVVQLVLRDISNIVRSLGKNIKHCGLPDMDESDDPKRDYYRELTEEQKVGFSEEDLKIVDTLNNEQKAGFDEIMDHVLSKKGCIFFVDGPGGTGKTYLYKALLAKVRSMNLIAIATATSGIAASIMPGGRTAHSRFEIPIKMDDNSTCKFSKQSGTALLLRTASLIIWDEVAMTRRQAVEILDRSLQDIMDCSEPFGGKVMVFGGDFRQVLPVVPRGTRAQITDATLQRSYIWEKIKKIQLKQNMRAQSDIWYSNFLLRIGNGTEDTYTNDYVKLPEDIVIDYNSEKSLDTLIERVFPDLRSNYTSTSYMSERAILSTRNEHVDAINARMIDMFPGEEKVYFSHDSVDDDTSNNYPLDFLNSITPNALPPHQLKVKKNCPIILLRNLDPHKGLCNGTRLVVRGFQNNAIDAEIVNGQYAGNRVFLPRIPLSPSEDITLPFKFKRKQFPIRLSFAMTINKAQGQTIPNVGIYLPEPVFSHGQLYVALSRGVSRKTTWVLAKPNKDVDPTGKTTKNIVYKDVLEA